MVYTVTITSQGQLSLPIKIRRELGFEKTRKVLVSVQDKKVILEPVKDFLDLKGSLKTTKPPLTSEQIHEMFLKERTKRFIPPKNS